MKTERMKIKKRLLKRDQEQRRANARLKDLKKLRRAVWLGGHRIIAFFFAMFGIRAFNWDRRYENKYLISWARQEGWSPARLTVAVDMVDTGMRIRANQIARRMDAIRRRARNIMKFNRRKRREKEGV